MRKLFLIVILSLLTCSLQAQRKSTTDVPMSGTPLIIDDGETAYFTMSANTVLFNTGTVGFTYTVTVDTLNTVLLQGRGGSSSNWVTVSTETTKVAGTYGIWDDTPNYTSYRLAFTVGADDSLIITEVRNILKED